MVRTLQFLAVLFTALSLVPAGAHLMEIAGKLELGQADYITVQQLYRGWNISGIFLAGALIFGAWLAFVSRTQAAPLWWAVIGTVLMAITLVSFFIQIYPVNQTTENWTLAPENWEALRTRWEYTHAVDAVLTLGAFVAMLLASLNWQE